MTTRNHCTACGACCACFTVVVEALDIKSPAGDYCPPFYLVAPTKKRGHAMKGTEGRRKRCEALNGIVGQSVFCTIYSRRPAACRNFLAAWQPGIINPKCDLAREVYGLFAFTPF